MPLRSITPSATALLTTMLCAVVHGTVATADNPALCGETPNFPDWRTWTSATEEPIVSPGHSHHWVGVYVDELAESTYLSAGALYPACSRIVKPIYADEAGTEVMRLTVMVKMPPGYDSDHGDWWYGVYDADGMTARRAGRLQDCIRCHAEAADTDYLFSRDVMLIIE